MTWGPRPASCWRTEAAAQGNAYAQFFLDRFDENRRPELLLAAAKPLHRMGSVRERRGGRPPYPQNVQKCPEIH